MLLLFFPLVFSFISEVMVGDEAQGDQIPTLAQGLEDMI
jgi:hypothetical protein